MAQVGMSAPDFTLVDTERTPRSLKEFIGKKTLLAFYPGAFTGVCTREMCALRDSMAQFNAIGANVVGISVDSPFANKAFQEANKLQFPLLSDVHREAVRMYEIELRDFGGVPGYVTAQRSVFILNEDGTIVYRWVAENPGIEPDYEELREILGKT